MFKNYEEQPVALASNATEVSFLLSLGRVLVLRRCYTAQFFAHATWYGMLDTLDQLHLHASANH